MDRNLKEFAAARGSNDFLDSFVVLVAVLVHPLLALIFGSVIWFAHVAKNMAALC